MINLIRNELSKIFFKNSTYVMLVVMFLFVVLTNVIYKTELDENGEFKSDYYNSNYLKNAKEKLDKSDNESKTNIKKDILKYELYEKYGPYSWQAYIINNKMEDIIDTYVKSNYNLDEEYNFYLDKFDKDDWKYFVLEEIDLKKKELSDNLVSKEIYDIDLEVLNYRLNHDISYAYSYLNSALEDYSNAKKYISTTNLSYLKEEDKLNSSNDRVYNYYKNISDMNINKYILDNKINAKKANDTRGILINLFNEYEIILVILIVMTSSVIIPSEFNKGTIKQLLLVPYKRSKILFSKYITCLLMFLFNVIILILMQVLVGSILFKSTLSIPVVVYNFNSNMIETYNIFYYLFLQLLAKIPMFIIIITFVFFISIITLNSVVTTILGLGLYLITPMVNELIINSKLLFLNLTIFPHLDFTQYLFGTISRNIYGSINTSIIVVILYFVVFFILSYVVFNEKDIKNI